MRSEAWFFYLLILTSPGLSAGEWVLINSFGTKNTYTSMDICFTYRSMTLRYPGHLDVPDNKYLISFYDSSYLSAIPLSQPQLLSTFISGEPMSDDFTILLEGSSEVPSGRMTHYTQKLLQLMRYGEREIYQRLPELNAGELNAVMIACYFYPPVEKYAKKASSFLLKPVLHQRPEFLLALPKLDMLYLMVNNLPHLAVIPFSNRSYLAITIDLISFISTRELLKLISEYDNWIAINFNSLDPFFLNPATLADKSTSASAPPRLTSFHFTPDSPETFAPSMSFIHLFSRLDTLPTHLPPDCSKKVLLAAELARWTSEEKEEPAPDCPYIK